MSIICTPATRIFINHFLYEISNVGKNFQRITVTKRNFLNKRRLLNSFALVKRLRHSCEVLHAPPTNFTQFIYILNQSTSKYIHSFRSYINISVEKLKIISFPAFQWQLKKECLWISTSFPLTSWISMLQHFTTHTSIFVCALSLWQFIVPPHSYNFIDLWRSQSQAGKRAKMKKLQQVYKKRLFPTPLSTPAKRQLANKRL